MSRISVIPLEPGRYEVEVREGGTTTSHKVAVPSDLLDELGLSDLDPLAVVQETFAFLLDREPATSILTQFSLDQVPRYFPDFYEELRVRLGS